MAGPSVLTQSGELKRQGDSLAPGGVGFSAYKSTTTAGYANNAAVVFDVEDYDPFGWYDPATGRFTPKVAGYYRFTANIHVQNPGGIGSDDAILLKNGVSVAAGRDWYPTNDPAAGFSPTVTRTIYLNGTTDYVSVALGVYGGVGATRGVVGSALFTFFEGWLEGVSVGVIPEPWHVVGAPGEPAFQSGWTAYNSGLAFCKMPDGTVCLKGEALAGTWTAGTTIFTLPVGYRPGWRGYFPVYMDSAPNVGVVGVQTNGAVQTEIRAGTATHIHGFAAVSFRAEQ